jgi:hypothetical protein
MHVSHSSKLTKLIVASSFVFLLILFGLTMTDYLSRGMQPNGQNTPIITQEH